MSLSLIVFDCDGVLLESVDAKSRAFHRIGLDYGQQAAERLAMYHALHGGVSRMVKFEWLFTQVLKRPITENDKRALNDKFVQYCYDEIRACVLVPGVQETLDAWHTRLPMYVASGAPQSDLDIILQERGLAKYFTGIHGSPPGKTALLRTIVQQAGVHPAQTIMIGDSQTDLDAALAVDCLFYGRGQYFAAHNQPWHHDLTRLNAHLEALCNQTGNTPV